jgi:uncharacterized protein with GYD domain
MAKYLLQVSYTTEGAKGLLKQGGSARRDVVAKLCEGLGGSLESFYYAFGDVDAYVVVDLPSNVSVAATSLTVAAAGAATITTIPLMTCEEIDAASKQSVEYRPPS